MIVHLWSGIVSVVVDVHDFISFCVHVDQLAVVLVDLHLAAVQAAGVVVLLLKWWVPLDLANVRLRWSLFGLLLDNIQRLSSSSEVLEGSDLTIFGQAVLDALASCLILGRF